MYNEITLLFALIFVVTGMIALRACRCEPPILQFKKEFINELKKRFDFVDEIIENHFVTLVYKAHVTIHIIERDTQSVFMKLNTHDFEKIFDQIFLNTMQCELIAKKIYEKDIKYIIRRNQVTYKIRISLFFSSTGFLYIYITELHQIPVTED